MRRAACLFAVAAALCAPERALADASVSEFGVAAGASTMSVQKAPTNEFEGIKTYNLGGPSVLAGVTVFQNSRVSARLLGNMVIDVNDSAVLRYGISSAVGYHLLGGPLYHVETLENATIGNRYPFCLTALFQPSFNRYAFPDSTSTPAKPLNATVLETAVGLEFTRAFFFDSSVGAMILGSLKSFYVTGDRVALQTLDVLVSWRTSL
jgi:hypothetical protein